MNFTIEHKELYNEIDAILWNDWDPIGVNDDGPRDEYQRYTATIFGLFIHGANQEVIANKLFEMETESIGISGRMENCVSVAKKIMGLKSEASS